MLFRRSISWNAALRDLRDDRAKAPAGFLSAKARVEVIAHLNRRPLVTAGRFDRASIMAAAVYAARAHQERFGGTWAEAMSVCLTAAWRAAKVARALAAH